MGNVRKAIIERAARGEIDGYDAPTTFSLDQPTGVIKQVNPATGEVRPSEPPEDRIEEFRILADTDPHVGEAIDTLVDFLVGSGFNIQPANIPGTDTEQTDEDIGDFKYLIETSTFETVLIDWVWHALVDGTGILEVVVEDDVFKPKVLPTEKIEIQTDEFGDIVGYIMEGEGDDDIEFEPYDLAILRFHRHPGEDFGHSLLERAQEQADMLRDMEIDMARFIATKAYPPILWKLGTEDRPWNEAQIEDWLEEVENIEPESMLAVGHDVDHDSVGVNASSSASGAMNLEDTFKHLQSRIAAAIGVPAFLVNMDVDAGRNESVAVMPAFDRRIQKYRSYIKQAIRHQVFVSILADDPETYDELPPDFEFGQHSSEEDRLDADMAIKLVNNGLLTFEAAAKRIGIDPETELPQEDEIDEHVELISLLAGRGDDIQNSEGGAPTDTGGGADSAGGEVKSRQNPERDSSDGRNQQDVSA